MSRSYGSVVATLVPHASFSAVVHNGIDFLSDLAG
jgi:hypothetical protein